MHIGPYTAPVQKSAMSIAHSWGAGTFIWHAAHNHPLASAAKFAGLVQVPRAIECVERGDASAKPGSHQAQAPPSAMMRCRSLAMAHWSRSANGKVDALCLSQRHFDAWPYQPV